MVQNFSFLLEDKLAGSARPGLVDGLAEDLQALEQRRITATVTLTETPLPVAMVAEAGMEYKHLPVQDFTPPSLGQMADFHRFVEDHLAARRGAVLVHCHAGVGRTGTMLASFLVARGMSADEAIAAVRKARPGSLETKGQVEAVHRWEERLRPGTGTRNS